MLWSLAMAMALGANDRVIHLEGYASYGGPSWFTLSGRVLEGPAPQPPDPNRSRLHNVADTLSLVESDEIAGAVVTASLGGRTYQGTSDADGVFVISGREVAPPLAAGRHDVELRAEDHALSATGKAELYIVADRSLIAVVSDVDDTVIDSHVTDWLKMATTVATQNAAQRQATPGMPAAYRAAQTAGASAFFYVSSSPQNLYSRLRAFLDLAGYPGGPLLLKNFGEDPITDHQGYKTKRLETLLAAYPKMRFVLIGDSGEQDPVIYRAVRAAHPERIVAIVIREVAGRPLGTAGDLVVVHGGGENAAVIGQTVSAAKR